MAQANVPGIDPKVQQLCEDFRRDYRAVHAEIGKAIIGHEEIVDGVLTCLFVGGHALLAGVPGLGKTALIRALADALHPSSMRAVRRPHARDITGTNIIQENQAGHREQVLRRANRESYSRRNQSRAKTQSALLEACRKNRSPPAGRSAHSSAFFVMAQTRSEQEGTASSTSDRSVLRARRAQENPTT